MTIVIRKIDLRGDLRILLEMAGAERLELSTVGFGDRCSTIRTMPLQNVVSLCHRK